MKRPLLAVASVLALGACATGGEPSRWADDRALQRLTADRLVRFDSESEFIDYLKRVRDLARARGEWWAGEPVQYASLDQPPVPCDPSVEKCPEKSGPVVVTGSKISAPASLAAVVDLTNFSPGPEGAEATITNVQKAGVDEGDIVKRIGKHLIVLQDGRLFSVDTETLTLSDRENVYASGDDDAWYDEILVSGRRVLVTGYSYREDATQLTVMAMDAAGRFTAEGTFYLTSNDYYDTSNYATRLVGDQLVIYSPMDLTEINPDRPVTYPVVRRWSEAPASQEEGVQLFDARSIYKPLQQTAMPTVHTVSVCDLDAEAVKQNLACRTTAFTGPSDRTYYVSPDDVFVWLTNSEDLYDDTCSNSALLKFSDAPPSTVFRIPLSGAKPTAMHVRGMPRDQFAMDTSTGQFRALLYWGRTSCRTDRWGYWEEGDVQVRYFSAPMSMFRDDIRTPAQARYVDLPPPGGEDYENRFTDSYVVYGGRAESWGGAPDQDEAARTAHLVAVNLSRPAAVTQIDTPHDINRLERIGADIVATGYHDRRGLAVSTVDLDGRPSLSDTLTLQGRFESEGRSHAFNARLEADGDGMMGLPTVKAEEHSGRYPWWSEVSDVSFMAFDRAGTLSDAGALTGRENSEDASYRCEVSCIDWYGNARPIFIGGRIFALTGTEIVEGRVAEGRVVEVKRLNLTAPIAPSSASGS